MSRTGQWHAEEQNESYEEPGPGDMPEIPTDKEGNPLSAEEIAIYDTIRGGDRAGLVRLIGAPDRVPEMRCAFCGSELEWNIGCCGATYAECAEPETEWERRHDEGLRDREIDMRLDELRENGRRDDPPFDPRD